MKSLQLFFTVLLLLTQVHDIQSQDIVKEKSINFWQDIGHVYYEASDFDEDGKVDILADVNARTQLIVGNIENGSRMIEQHQSSVFQYISMVHFLDTNDDGERELYVFDSGKDSLYHLDFPSLETIKSYRLISPYFSDIEDLTFGSIDKGGPNVWYASTGYNGVYALSPTDFSIIEELPDALQASKMYIGNFDTDPENEILLRSSLSLQILNTETFAVEYEVEGYVHKYKVADFNKDGIQDIIVRIDNYEVHIYDFSQADPISIIDNLDIYYESFAIADIDNDNIEDIILYDGGQYDNDIVKINGSTMEVSYLDLPYNSQNYSGLIISTDNIIHPEAGNLLFSGSSLHSVSAASGELKHTVFSIANIAIHGLDHYISGDEKQIVISEVAASSGENIDNVILMNYENQEVVQQLSPKLFAPEENSVSLKSEITTYSTRNPNVKDLIFTSRYSNKSTFYSPSGNEIYNSEEFKQSYVKTYDLDLDGNEELISVDQGLDEITIYKSESKYDWNQILKIEASADFLEFYQMDDDPAIELIVYGNNKLQIIDSATGELTELETDFWLSNSEDVAIFETALGNFRFVFLTNLEIILYDPISQTTIKSLEIPPYQQQSLESIQMIVDGMVVNYVIVYGNLLSVLDESLNTVMEMENPSRLAWPYVSEIIVHNNDGDQHPNIIVSHKYGIDDYELKLEGEYRETFNLINHYPKNDIEVSLYGKMFLEFNEEVELADLEEYLSIYFEDDMSEIPYSIQTDDNYKFDITPFIPFEPEKRVELVLSKDLQSKNSKHIEFPLENQPNEDFRLNFGLTDQSLQPEITLTSGQFNTSYNDSKRQISVSVNANSEDPIRSVSARFVGDPYVYFLPIDQVFDETEEQFLFVLDFFDKDLGTATYSIIAESYNGTTDTLEFTTEVVSEVGYPFKRDGVDQLNTFYKPMDSLGNKIVYLWTKPLSEVLDSEAPVVGEGDFIYLRKNEGTISDPTVYLYKLKKTTGETVYKKAIAQDARCGNLLLDNGFIYLQINNYDGLPKLTCLDAENGNLVWETSFRNQHTEKYAPVVNDSYILMSGGQYGGVYCFDRWTGKELWFDNLEQQGDWTPSVYNDVVYTSAGGIINAYRIDSGELLWTVVMSDAPYFTNISPIIDEANNLLIFNTSEGIYTIDLDDQTTNLIGDSSFGDPNLCLRDGFIYQVTTSKLLHKINVLTGEKVTTIDIPASRNEVYIFGDLIFVNGDAGTYLYGVENLEYKGTIDETNYALNLVDDIFFVSYQDELVAYQLENQCIEYASFNEVICFGGEIEIGNTIYNEEGTYSDTIIGMNECYLIFNLDLMISEELTLTDVLITNDNGNGSGSIAVFPEGGTSPYTYSWSNGETTQLISDLPSGEYTVTVTDQNGCSFEFEYEVLLVNGVEDIGNDLSIYPNLIAPSENVFLYGLEKGQLYTVSIYGIDGVKIYNGELKGNAITFPTAMNDGLYFIVISETKSLKTFTRKIVVNNLR